MINILEYIKKTKTSDYVDTMLDSAPDLLEYLKIHGFIPINTHHTLNEYIMLRQGQKCYVTGEYSNHNTHWIAVSDGRDVILKICTKQNQWNDPRFEQIERKTNGRKELTSKECIDMLKYIAES